MLPHITLRFGCIAFLLGVGATSIGMGAGWIIIAALIASVTLIALHFSRRSKLLAYGKDSRAFLALTVIALAAAFGALYNAWHTMRYKSALPDVLVQNRNVDIEGVVTSNPHIIDGRQEFAVRGNAPEDRYIVKGRMYPRVSYGDRVRVSGTVRYPETLGSRGRLMRQGAYGTLIYPSVYPTAHVAAPGFRGRLYAVRNAFRDSFVRMLPSDEAALVNGITLGGYSGLGADLKDAMRRSGTLHLIALSGYNITIVASLVVVVCLTLFGRRTALAVSVGAIALFVLMTGAEASVVRAALMGALGAVALHMRRARNSGTAIAATAALMVLANPKTLVFDTGFQLSFLALLGIVYLRPLLARLSKFKNKGVVSWKEHVLTTVSAQIAVAPLLLAQFGGISIAAVPANLMIIWLIPGIMFLGFAAAALCFIAYPLALPFGFLLHTPLAYVIAIIQCFG